MGAILSRRLYVVAFGAGLVLVALIAVWVGFSSRGDDVSANAGLGAAHGALVDELPVSGWPKVLGTPTYINTNDPFNRDVELQREVEAAVEVGNIIVLGGNFEQVELTDGTVIEQKYLVAFDRNTGELVNGFDLVLDREVESLHVDADGTSVLVGGAFRTVDGQNFRKLFRVDPATGVVDPTFAPQPEAVIDTIDVTSTGRLFVGGPFNSIGGVSVADVAELDPVTGTPVPEFNFAFEGIAARGTYAQFSNGEVKHVEATPDGNTLVVVHRAATVDGQTRSGYAIFDISNPLAPVLTPDHSNTFFSWPNCPGGALPTSGAVSPDGSFLVMGTVVYDQPNCHDAVLAFPIGGGADAPERWAKQMRDSVFSVAISDVAVYAGGHFCRIEAGPGETQVDGRVSTCSGSNMTKYPEGAWRWQLAALSPADGTPLDWDPGVNAIRGARFMEATDSGLLIGFDGDRVNDINTGAFALLPIDPTAPPPTTTSTSTSTTSTTTTTTSTTTTTTTTTLPPATTTTTTTTQPPAPIFCGGRVATIVGTDGNDLLNGTAGADVIVGLGGNDLIYGLGGNDTICAGDGADNVWGGDGNDYIAGGAGDDRLKGQRGRDTIVGEAGRDALVGGGGSDVVSGGPGDDRIRGGPSADRLMGNNGRDRLLGGPANDDLIGGAGDDRLLGGPGVDFLNGGGGSDRCVQAGGGVIRRCETLN